MRLDIRKSIKLTLFTKRSTSLEDSKWPPPSQKKNEVVIEISISKKIFSTKQLEIIEYKFKKTY